MDGWPREFRVKSPTKVGYTRESAFKRGRISSNDLSRNRAAFVIRFRVISVYALGDEPENEQRNKERHGRCDR